MAFVRKRRLGRRSRRGRLRTRRSRYRIYKRIKRNIRQRYRRRRTRKARIPKALYNELNPLVTEKWEQGSMVNAKSVGTKYWGVTYPTGNMFDCAQQMQTFGNLGVSLQPNSAGVGTTFSGPISGATAQPYVQTGTLRRNLYIKKHTVKTVFHNCTNGTQYYTAYYVVAKRDITSNNCRFMNAFPAQYDHMGLNTWTGAPFRFETMFDHSYGGVNTQQPQDTDITIADMLHRGMCSNAGVGGGIANASNLVINPPVGNANALYMYKGGAASFVMTGTAVQNTPAVGLTTLTDATHGQIVNPTTGGADQQLRNSYIYHKDCTPYRSTEFLSYFKIYKVKKFALKPGETKIIRQSTSKRKIPYQWLIENTFLGTNTSSIGDSKDEAWAMKGVTKFVLFSQVGSVVTADAKTFTTTEGADIPAWEQLSMSTANTCTGLIARMKFVTRLLKDSQKWVSYRQNHGVLDYKLNDSYKGWPADQKPAQNSAHHLNVKIITATTQGQADVPINPT